MSLEPEGGDSDRMLDVETRLRTEIGDIDTILTTHIATALSLAPDAAVPLEHATSLVGTFCQETAIVADTVLGCRQALGFADGTPIDLAHKLHWLNHSFTDNDGAQDAPDTSFEDLVARTLSDDESSNGFDGVEELLDEASSDLERRAIWDTLSIADQFALIDQRPDLGLTFLGADALTEAQLQKLRASTEYVVASTELELSVDGEFDAKLFTLVLGGGVSVTVEELSDGTFKLLLGTDAYAGVEKEIDVKGVEVSAGLRAIIETGEVLQFEDIEGGPTAQEQVVAAVTALTQAIDDDASDWWGTGRFAVGAMTDNNPVSEFIDLIGLPTPGEIIAGDQTPESFEVLGELLEEHGTSRRVAAGVEGSASAELDAFGLGGLDGTAKVSVVVYTVDGLNGGTDSNGVVVAGSLEGAFSRDSTPLVPGTSNQDITGGGTIGFSSDTSLDEHGNIVNVTTLYVETKIGTVESLGLGDTVADAAGNPAGSSVTVEASADVTQRHTVTITTPVDGDTGDLVVAATTGLAEGDLDGLMELYDQSDVVVTSEQGAQATASVTVDAEIIKVEVTVSETDTVTTSSEHKPAGGESYDQIEANEQIDRAAQEFAED